MPALVAGIHVLLLLVFKEKTWMARDNPRRRGRACHRAALRADLLDGSPGHDGVSQLHRNLVSIFKQPPSFSRARLRPELWLLSPQEARGAERRDGAGADRRTSWPASRSGRSPVPRRSPVHDRRASRRSTAAISVLGPRFSSRPLLVATWTSASSWRGARR